MDHHTTIREVGEGGVQAVCSCGWRSPVSRPQLGERLHRGGFAGPHNVG